ncbi:MAG: adenylate/guanylate cyclase domain-containing protein [Ginsengibacter sp.]
MNKWFEHVKFYIVGWFFAAIFLYIMRQVGVVGINGVNIPLKRFLILLPGFAIVPGFIFGSLQYFFEKNIKRKIPLILMVVRVVIVQLIVISILTLGFYALVAMMENKWSNFYRYVFSSGSFVLNFYVLLANLFFAILIEIIRLIGKNNFIKILTGRFFNPQEEYRIFMFIDLNSSTTIAEKLGHVNYSNFIQDCFSDMDIVHNYGAEIYQYVGDEAVLTWEYAKMTSVIQSIDAFWAFQTRLQNESEYYFMKYGMVPEFKAGMSIGMVSVVEIGKAKKEIAYHGNTLNTAARVVALCNVYKEKLLITRKLYDEYAKVKSKYIFKKITETQLRGKQGMTEIYSVSLPVTD